MRRMTIGATDVVAPVFTTAEVVAFLFAGMTRKTSLGNLFRRLILETDNLCRIAFFRVCLAWSMTSFASGYFVTPTTDLGEFRVRSVRKRLELIFMTVLARVAADVIRILLTRSRGWNIRICVGARVRVTRQGDP